MPKRLVTAGRSERIRGIALSLCMLTLTACGGSTTASVATPAPLMQTPPQGLESTVLATPQEQETKAATTMPTATALGASVSYIELASGSPSAGGLTQPIAIALDVSPTLTTSLPAGLSDEAKAAVASSVGSMQAGPFLVIAAGTRPSAGYRIIIQTIERQDGRVVVRYTIEKPQGGAADVITYPFLVARLDDPSIQAQDVVFEAAG